MAADFKTTIAALLHRLGLEPGETGDDGSLLLGSGDIDIRLADDGLGRYLVVSAVAGRLDERGDRRMSQVSRVLELHAEAIGRFGAAVSIDAENDADIVVSGTVPYGRPVDDVVRLIEHVGTLAGLHANEIRPGDTLFGVPEPSPYDNTLIFRP